MPGFKNECSTWPSKLCIWFSRALLCSECTSQSECASFSGNDLAWLQRKCTESEFHSFRPTPVLLLEVYLWQAHQRGPFPPALKPNALHCFFFIIIFHSSLSHSLVSTSIPNIMSCTPLSLIQLLSAHIMIHTRSDTFRNPQTSEECLKNVWIQCGFKALTDSAMLRTKRPALWWKQIHHKRNFFVNEVFISKGN